MIPRLGLYAFGAAGAFIVLLAGRQWLRQRKADRQWARASAERYRAAEARLAQIADLEALYAAESHQEEDHP